MSSPINTKSTSHGEQAHPVPSNAQVAHELANLLDGSMRNVNLVRAFLNEQASSELPTDTDVTQRLQSAEQGMRQMAMLLRKWLQASQVDATATTSKAIHDHTADDLHDATIEQAVGSALEQQSPRAHQHAIEVVTQIEPNVANFPAGELFHIVSNAVRNAIEAIAQSPSPVESPRIEVAVFSDRDHLVMQVADNGTGIQPEMLDKHGDCRIGETSKPNGHGIGLALCRDIARNLGGTVRLNNRLPQGAMFTLRIPATALLK